MVVARCTRCGAPIRNAPAFCRCGAYVFPEDRPLIASGSAKESSATVTEAFTYVPPATLPAEQIQTEAVPEIEQLPYAYGKFQGVMNILVGVGFIVAGFVTLKDIGLLLLVFGGLCIWLGWFLFKRARLAMQVARVCAGIGLLGNGIGLLAAIGGVSGSAVVSSIIGLAIGVANFIYFNKRLD
jgi:hypothetical protein